MRRSTRTTRPATPTPGASPTWIALAPAREDVDDVDIPSLVPVGLASGSEDESVLLWVHQVLPHGELLVFGG